MKKERVALRAQKGVITIVVVFTMLISGLAVIPTTPTVIAQDIGGEYGGDFRVALQAEPTTFNPLNASINDAAEQIIDLLYDSLGRVKPDSLMLEPWVAKEWNVDPDNQSIVTVVLRNDVLWHDSTPLTTADVSYTFGPNGYDISYLVNMVIVDSYTITFNLDAPNALFFSEILQMKLVPVGFEADDEENGCGPFSLVGEDSVDIWDYNGQTTRKIWTIEAFDDYFTGRPYLDSIVFTYYQEGFFDTISKTGAGYDLLNCTLDFIGWELSSNETASTVIEIPRAGGMNTTLANPDEENTTVNSETSFDYRYLGMNTARSHLLNDVNLRMAIAHVVNKQNLARYDISGGLVVADSIVSPEVTPWFNTSLEKTDHDVAMANQILDDAGYFDVDGDGFRDLQDGSDFQFELLIPTQDEDISALSMGNDFSTWINAIGINLTVNMTLDFDARMQRVQTDNFDMLLSTESRGGVDPSFLYDVFHSSRISTTETNHNLFNFEGRHRERYGIVSVNNTTMIGQMNHTNLFDDGTVDIEAYRDGVLWGVADGQMVWTSDGTLPIDLPLKNESIDTGSYTIYRNRSVDDEAVWSVTLNDVTEEKINVTATQILVEWLVTVNTTFNLNFTLANSARYNVVGDIVDVNLTGGPSNLTNRPVDSGTPVELLKEGDVQEPVTFLGTGVQNVLLVDADNTDGGVLVDYYNWACTNNSAIVTVWDVYGNAGAPQGKPVAADMIGNYNVVIWIPNGHMDAGVSFDATDEGEVASYLDSGGTFMLANGVWSDYTDGTSQNYDAGDFAYDYMGIDEILQTQSFSETDVTGIGGSIFNGWGPATFDWNINPWFGFYGELDELQEGIGTQAMENEGFELCGLQYDSGTFKTVFFGFGFEGLQQADADSAMALILDWFVPPSAGCEGQLTHGANANETILNWELWDQEGGVYRQKGTEYTLNPNTGYVSSVLDLTSNTTTMFYNYTTEMFEGIDYTTMNAWHFWNGKVNLTISINPVEDTVKANYTWYDEVNGGNLVINPGMTDIIDNYTLKLNDVLWPEGGNYVLDNSTGVVTFNNPLAPGDYVNATYSCFDNTYFAKTFTWPLAHGAGTVDIVTTDFHLKKNGADMAGGDYNLNDGPGTIDLLAGGILTYEDTITADYWYYDTTQIPGSVVYSLAHGESTDGNHITNLTVRVFNNITKATVDYTAAACNADLTEGTFEFAVTAGDLVTAIYQYYDPTEIVYIYNLLNTPVSAGTLAIYLNGTLVSENDYTVNWATGQVDLDEADVPLGPQDMLTADYYFFNNLIEGAGLGFTIDTTNGILSLNADVQVGDFVLADYTYETYEMVDFETGQIRVLNNFDVNNDTLTMNFDYRKFDELIELSNQQMSYDSRAMYIKEAQGFLSEELPCIPLFSSKVANAYNNTRYEGWASTVGGLINFWSYTQLRNIIFGEMQVSVSAFPGYVTEEEDIDLVVKVEDLDGNYIPEAHLEFDGAGVYGTSTWDAQAGTYTVPYTAPSTSTSRTITIAATVTRPSYVRGTGEVQLTVHPVVSEFSIEISRGATSIDSGNVTDIMVTVRDKDTMVVVTDVELSLSVSPLSLGGYLNDTTGTTDATGEFTTEFGAINVTVDTTFTVTVTASKDGYIDKTQSTSISVSRDPSISGVDRGLLGLPGPSLLVILMMLAGLSIFYARRRRD